MDIPECVAVWKRLINTLRDFSLQGEVPHMQGISSLLIKLIHKNKGSVNTALLSKTGTLYKIKKLILITIILVKEK